MPLGRRRRRVAIAVVVVAVGRGGGVSRGLGAVRGPAHVAVRRRREVEDLACFHAPVHELVADHVIREEVRKVHKVIAVRVELGRLLVAQVPVRAEAVLLGQRGDEDGVPISRVNHPQGLVRQDIDVARREPDLLAQLAERGLVRGFVAVSPPAEILPNAAGAPHEGAVLAHDEDAGTREAAVGVDADVEHGVLGLSARR